MRTTRKQTLPLFRLVATTLLAVAMATPVTAQPAAPHGDRAIPRPPVAAQPPAPQREFRGLWVATVANIDWPSKPGLPAEQQRGEMLAILDRAKELNFNAIVLQIRPTCDALYPSRIEPWSHYLTGRMGQPPSPPYDPLEFAVTEAHKRSLEMHAWLNPYRAGMGSSVQVSDDHVSKSDPQIVRKYGSKLWLDPGMEEAQDYSLRVIMDVVRRYDLDGVHFDDYFYPYVERDKQGKAIPFPDAQTYQRYRSRGGTMSLDDWRRDNVNRFIKTTYTSIKRDKPHVKFGISPFGIWKSGVPAGISGLTAYQELYADSRLWLTEGWVDYFAPQLYWRIDAERQSFPKLLDWWVSQNTQKRHIWPGLHTGLTGAASRNAFEKDEIANQIAIVRRTPGATGTIHFSARAIMRNQGGIADTLLAGPYRQPALMPETPWLPGREPARPNVRQRRANGALHLEWDAADSTAGADAPRKWAVYTLETDGWTMRTLPGSSNTLELPLSLGTLPQAVAVSAVNGAGTEGPRTVVPVMMGADIE